MPGGRVWRHKADVAQVQSPDRFAVLDLEHLDRPPLVLAGSAAVIWELLDGERDEAEVGAAVAEHFGDRRARRHSRAVQRLPRSSSRELTLIVEVEQP